MRNKLNKPQIEHFCRKVFKISFHFALILFEFLMIEMSHAEAQMIYTKDGHEIGLKEEILPFCIKSAQESLSNVPGVHVNPTVYCNCAIDLVYPNITFAEIEFAIKQNEIQSLFTREDNFQIIMKCLEGNITYDDQVTINSDNHPNFDKIQFINRCMQEIEKNTTDKNTIPKKEAFDYCTCTIEGLLKSGYTYEEWLNADDESSIVYNEIIVSCADQYISDRIPKNQYASKDIIGQSSMSEIPLLEIAGLGYKIKINLDGITRYFLLDTGASELIIDRELERELLINGAIKKENYLSKTTFKIANNQVVPVQLIKLDHIQIGDYTANNVIIGVIEEGSLLCGIGFLNKFKNWKIDESRKKLIIYK